MNTQLKGNMKNSLQANMTRIMMEKNFKGNVKVIVKPKSYIITTKNQIGLAGPFWAGLGWAFWELSGSNLG